MVTAANLPTAPVSEGAVKWGGNRRSWVILLVVAACLRILLAVTQRQTLAADGKAPVCCTEPSGEGGQRQHPPAGSAAALHHRQHRRQGLGKPLLKLDLTEIVALSAPGFEAVPSHVAAVEAAGREQCAAVGAPLAVRHLQPTDSASMSI